MYVHGRPQEFFQGGEHNVPQLYFSARVLKMHNNKLRTRTIALCGLLLFLCEIGLKLKSSMLKNIFSFSRRGQVPLLPLCVDAHVYDVPH